MLSLWNYCFRFRDRGGEGGREKSNGGSGSILNVVKDILSRKLGQDKVYGIDEACRLNRVLFLVEAHFGSATVAGPSGRLRERCSSSVLPDLPDRAAVQSTPLLPQTHQGRGLP